MVTHVAVASALQRPAPFFIFTAEMRHSTACEEGCHHSGDPAKSHRLHLHIMKAQFTLDFLRGILFAYIANQAWACLHFIFLGIAPFQPIQVIVPASLFLIYAFLLVAVLFRPFFSAKAVFVSLLILAILYVGSVGVAFVLSHHPAFSPLDPQSRELFSISNHAVSLFLAIGSVAVAYLFYRKQKQLLKSA